MIRTVAQDRPVLNPWLHNRYLLEHGLKADGHLNPDAVDETRSAGSFETFFSESSNGKYVPRSIFVDLDPSVGLLSSQFHWK